MDNVLAKIVKKSIFSEMKLTIEEMRFISFKDLSCILRSSNAFSVYI